MCCTSKKVTKKECKEPLLLTIVVILFTTQIVLWVNRCYPARVTKVNPKPSKGCHKTLNLVKPAGIVTALATFPGSGNTWTRHLIQEATGYQTGSVFHDYELLKNGYPGEGIRNGSVIIVKTHFPVIYDPKTHCMNPDQYIVIVRHPAKAIAADLTWQLTNSHTKGTVNPKLLDKRLRNNFDDMLGGWSSLHGYYLKMKETRKTIIISYSRLITDTSEVLEEILDFIDIKKNERFTSCALTNKEGPFHRKTHWSIDKHFTTAMQTAANETAKHFEHLLGFSIGYD